MTARNYFFFLLRTPNHKSCSFMWLLREIVYSESGSHVWWKEMYVGFSTSSAIYLAWWSWSRCLIKRPTGSPLRGGLMFCGDCLEILHHFFFEF